MNKSVSDRPTAKQFGTNTSGMHGSHTQCVSLTRGHKQTNRASPVKSGHLLFTHSKENAPKSGGKFVLHRTVKFEQEEKRTAF